MLSKKNSGVFLNPPRRAFLFRKQPYYQYIASFDWPRRLIVMSDISSVSDFTTLSTNAFSQLRQGRSIAEQSNVDISQLTEASSINELPSILVNRRAFVKEVWIDKKRKRWSWVQNHDTGLIEKSSKKAYWSCNNFDRQRKTTLIATDATSAMIRHLSKEHRVHADGEVEEDSYEDGGRA